MKNKKVIVLIVLLIVLFLSPIFFVKAKAILNLLNVDDASIEQANKEESERLLSEKEKFAQEHNDKVRSSIELQQSYSEKQENDAIYNQEEQDQINEKLDRTASIIKRYYENNFNEIVSNIEKEREENTNKVIILNEEPLSENEKELFKLVMTIIENEDLNDEECSLLVDYLKDSRFQINKDEVLKTRGDRIFEESK